MNVLVINCGSSSLKFAVFDLEKKACILKGMAEPLLGGSATLLWETENGKQSVKLPENADLESALKVVAEKLLSVLDLGAVGHRVVHGGEKFKSSILITEEVVDQIEACNNLAPLHNPANLLGIQVAQSIFSDIPHIAVFDTAFHQSIPQEAYLYPLPFEFYEELGIRRYGFHGTSHHYIFKQAAIRLDKPESETAIISAHLGNGCSATAAEAGKSLDTTMGLTPLEGLVMGTRCGDIDPSIHGFLQREKGLRLKEIDTILNKESGLLGLSGISNDMRTLGEQAEAGNPKAQLAIDVFVFRLAKAIASLRISLSHCDAIVFTGGIGENGAAIRKAVLERLHCFGCLVNGAANVIHGKESNGLITTENSALKAFVIPTNEELMIAQETEHVLK
ncbi:acetate kinase [Puniceicoccaceae bacterium K14]|nr:acetate kinase [Puniceicoccaceae bacterium K14]